MHKDHVLYETGDTDVPDSIMDRNGDVVLALCRKCGKGEVQLDGPCTESREDDTKPGRDDPAGR